ncbi:MAG: DUF167 domain-containing protein [Rickettsiales bacterium]|nr:MAG: DUF167 domain-containing protein [Rickettsiales bacterium]
MEEVFNRDYVLGAKKIYLKVKAGAKQNSIDGWTTIHDKKYLKISVKSLPVKGKANEMIIEFLAEKLNLSKHNIQIKSGTSSNLKFLIINI